jgi:DNA replication protein DnaC
MDPYQLAFDIALNTDRSLFVTGKAGTGKTTFLHRLKEASRKQMAVVAPTGVAAINAGGTTIHSFFQLPFTPFIPTPEGRKNLVAKSRMRSSRRRVLQELELLVIDEISMVRADLLDAMDATLRHFRYRNNELFGGVQVIFIGDMFQLAPVAKEEEWRLLSRYYQSPYFFHSQAVIQDPPFYIEFEKIYRQTNSSFIRVLNEIRDNTLTDESFRLLEKRYNPLFTPPEEEDYIILTTHNNKADRINAEELDKLEGETYTFEAGIGGDYPERNYPTEPVLELKVGARVMFLRNDTETPRRFYNGKIGVVDAIDDDRIVVRCKEDEYIEVERATWENIGYTVDTETKQVEENVLGKFSQYPFNRDTRDYERRLSAAHLPSRHDLDLFDFNFSYGITPGRMKELRELLWMEQAYNVILMGPSGTGKTYIASGLIYEAVKQGYKAYMLTMGEIITTIKMKEISPTAMSAYNRIVRADLIAIDDIMLFPVKKEDANGFFNLINTLHEKTSIIITTNKAPTEWAQTLDDEVLATALLDRLLYRCEVIKLTGTSYRMENRKSIFKEEL